MNSAAPRPNGLALVAVLWIVAFLSIIATGISRSIRLESRAIALSRQQIQAQALGDAAIQIALQALYANPQPLRQTATTSITYRGVAIRVQAMPLTGLIDLNAADQPLLERLFAIAGGLPLQAAQNAAQSVIATRASRGAQSRFEAVEDLLQVPGIDYDLYARLAPLLTTDLGVSGSSRVNPLAAPAPVLAVLAGGNAALAGQIAANRDAGGIGVDTSALDGALTGVTATTRLRVQASVPMDDGSNVTVARSVELRGRAADGGPWQTFRLTTAIEPAPH